MPNRKKLLVVPVVVGALMMALPALAAADFPHVVTPGETLTSVAATDGLTIAAVAAANDLSPTAELIAGEVLQIPAQTPYTAAGSSSQTEHGSAEGVDYSLTSAHVSPSTTGASTGSTSETSTSTATSTSDAATTTTVKTPVSPSAAGPYPTAERVSAQEIAQIADADGVPPGLAEGIAWQESGWDNDVVSSIGAVGVMQIVPTTWTWIDQYLTPSEPLAPASAAENVRGGVLLLHDLLELTGNNYELAVASYYQGLSSVRAHGMYADTRQYVADVLALAARFGG